MQAYLDLIQHVITNGTRKENRTGVDTLSTFNYNYELGFGKNNLYFDPNAHRNYYHLGDKFPLLTTKKISWKNIVVEMLWFLSGSTNIKILQQHNCKFWDHWSDDNGNVPSAYGNFWTNFPVHKKLDPRSPRTQSMGVDNEATFNNQIAWVIDQLRTNPMSRRLVVSAWAPGNAQTSKLPPCHFSFVFNVQLDQDGEQRLCLHLSQRSADCALGIPYNIASYSLLLMMFSQMTGIKPGIFAHSLIDAHIYTNKTDGSMEEYDHLTGLEEQLARTPKELPTLTLDPSIKELSNIEKLMSPNISTKEILDKFKLEGYDPYTPIKFKVAV